MEDHEIRVADAMPVEMTETQTANKDKSGQIETRPPAKTFRSSTKSDRRR